MRDTTHLPQRLDGESMSAYRERRAASKRQVRTITGAGLSGGTNSRKQQRDAMRGSGTMGKRIRAYEALMAAWASKRIPKAKHRDERGAYTCVGPVYEVYGMNPDQAREHVIGVGQESDGTLFYGARRKWLAGISAQRGF